MKGIKTFSRVELGGATVAMVALLVVPAVPAFAASSSTVSATFTNQSGQALADQGRVAVGSAIVVHPTSHGIATPWYQIWVKAPGGSWTNAYGYDPAPAKGFSMPVTATGTYDVNVYASDSSSGTSPQEAEYTFTGTQATGSISATFSNGQGGVLANGGPVATDSGIVVHPTVQGITDPIYQISVQSTNSPNPAVEIISGKHAVYAYGYRSAPSQGWTIPTTMAGTYNVQVSATSALAPGINPAVADYSFTVSGSSTSTSSAPGVSATFTNATGQAIANDGTVAVGSTIVVHPMSHGIATPWYQIWVKAPGSAWQNAYGYDPAPKAGFSVAVTKPGTYQIATYVSASVQGTHWVEAKYAFTAKGSALPQTSNGPTVSATFTNVNGKAIANDGTVAVGSAIVVHPMSHGIATPWYQIWVKTPTTLWTNAYGYDPAPKNGFSIPVTAAGTYDVHVYVSASSQGTNWKEAEYRFTGKKTS